jgi:hypothetical protein
VLFNGLVVQTWAVSVSGIGDGRCSGAPVLFGGLPLSDIDFSLPNSKRAKTFGSVPLASRSRMGV